MYVTLVCNTHSGFRTHYFCYLIDKTLITLYVKNIKHLGMLIDGISLESAIDLSQEAENRAAIWSTNSLLGVDLKNTKTWT